MFRKVSKLKGGPFMIKDENTNAKICAFFVSDYHFEMMSLPYINRCIENNKQIVVLTENNLQGTVKDVIERMNLKDERKEQFLSIDWNKNDFKKLKSIKNNLKDNENNVVVFIKGKEKYVRNMNKKIGENRNIKIIDCYDLEDVEKNINGIIMEYDKVLKTSGEEDVKKYSKKS